MRLDCWKEVEALIKAGGQYHQGHSAFVIKDRHGWFHCSDAPAYIDPENGTICWYRHNMLHRDDGPAVICRSGLRQYWKEGSFLGDARELSQDES